MINGKWNRGLVLLGVLLISLTAFSAFGADVLIEPAFEQRERPGALFNHDAHMEYDGVEDCFTCHHLYEDGQLVEGESSDDQLCSDCHKVRPDNGGTRLMTAFHRMCESCHDEQKKGPVSCGECHVRGLDE